MTVFWLLGAYVCGIMLADTLETPATTVLYATAVLLLTAWTLLRRSPWAVLPSMGAFLLLGFIWTGLSQTAPRSSDHVYRFIDEKPVVIEGLLKNPASFSDGRSRFDLDTTKVLCGTSAATVSGLVRVSVRQGGIPANEGQSLRLRCRLRAPRNFGTPGEFDYAGHLAAQKIFVTAHLADTAQIVPLASASGPQTSFIRDFRLKVATSISRVVPESEAGLVQALVIGLRDKVTPAQRRVIAEGGVAHLFAISGLHFGLLGLLLYVLLRRLYCQSLTLLLWCPPRRLIPLLLILPMAGYMLLTGSSLPTCRAFFMATAAALLYSSNRRTPALRLLTAAALLILLVDPLALFQPAFQLSFAGLLGILLWLPTWQLRFADAPAFLRWPLVLFLTTLAATVATAPLTLWHFHIFAPAGLLTNLAATPLLAWGAVPLGLAGVLLHPFAPLMADTCFAGCGALVALALSLVELFSGFPGLAARYYFPGLADILMLVAGLTFLSVRGKSWPAWLSRCVLAAAGLILFTFAGGQSNGLRVVALSVGQGDATLLSTGSGRHFLVDGGGLPGGGFDIGERLVAPALGRLNVKRLAGVILTHDHPDHRDGLRYVLEHFPVDAFYCGQPSTGIDPDLQRVLQQRSIPIKTLPDGWTTLPAADGPHLHVFTPRQNHPDKNERSLAVYAGLGEDGVLLTGDLGADGMKQIFDAGLPGTVNLLKLPHHGSRHSAPRTWLRVLTPSLAFVSAGRNNPHHLPHPDTLESCSGAGVPLFRTDTDGTLKFSSTGGGWSVPIRTQGFSVDET